MALLSGSGAGRVRPVRDVQAEQRARGGMSSSAEAAAQDDFAERLMRDAEAAERAQSAGRTKPRIDVAGQRAAAERNRKQSGMSEAARRAMGRADAPVTKERFIHETDIGNVDSIRRGGIRPSRGGGAMGHEGVYAYQGSAEGRRVPEGRALIEFEADPNRISGRGTMGSRAVALGGGSIEPGDITGGYNSSGRMFNLLGGSPYGGLYSLLAGVLGLPNLKTPGDWVLEGMFGNVRDQYGFVPGLEGAPTVLA